LSDCPVVFQSCASFPSEANEGITYRKTASPEVHATGCKLFVNYGARLYTKSHKTLLTINSIFKIFRWTLFRVKNIHYVNRREKQYNIYDTATTND